MVFSDRASSAAISLRLLPQGNQAQHLQFAIGECFVRGFRSLAGQLGGQSFGQRRRDVAPARERLADGPKQLRLGALLGHVTRSARA